MEHWEKTYGSHLLSSASTRDLDKRMRWENRVLPREQHLFQRLRSRPASERRRVLDVGCGSADTMAELLPPVPDGIYIGTDLSGNALRIASERVPHATFIRAATQALPFQPQSFDVLLVLGVMHHLPEPARATRRLVEQHLRPGGVLLMYEGIERPLPLPRRVVERFVPEESEHEERIPERELLNELAAICRMEHVKKEYTPVRTALVAALGKNLANRHVGRFVRGMDQLCADTIGKVLPAFAGGSLFVYATRM